MALVSFAGKRLHFVGKNGRRDTGWFSQARGKYFQKNAVEQQKLLPFFALYDRKTSAALKRQCYLKVQ